MPKSAWGGAVDALGRQFPVAAQAALGPAHGPLHGLLRVGALTGIRRAFVESHDNVGTEPMLNFHDLLRGEEVVRAVQVRLEAHAIGGDLVAVTEAEDLEAAAVGEDRLGPAHKGVESSQPVDELVTGAQVEVVGVAEDDLRLGGG